MDIYLLRINIYIMWLSYQVNDQLEPVAPPSAVRTRIMDRFSKV
jgi:hypothetical protein